MVSGLHPQCGCRVTIASGAGGMCGILGQLALFYLFSETGNSWSVYSMSFIMVVGYSIAIVRDFLLFRMTDAAMLPDAGGSLADDNQAQTSQVTQHDSCCYIWCQMSISKSDLPNVFLLANIIYMLGSGMTDSVSAPRLDIHPHHICSSSSKRGIDSPSARGARVCALRHWHVCLLHLTALYPLLPSSGPSTYARYLISIRSRRSGSCWRS